MKTYRKLLTFLLFPLVLSACSEKESIEPQKNGIVRLKALLEENRTTKIGDSWSGNERIGVYMIENDTFSVINDISNKEFIVSAGAGANLQPVDFTPIYPQDGREVRFVAYYPYNPQVTDQLYPIDLTDTNIADHDLLYSKSETAYNQEMTEAVPMLFTHQLSQLILQVKVQREGENGELVTDWEGSITRNMRADFNIADGNIDNKRDQSTLSFQPENSSAQLLLLPGKEGKINIRYAESDYLWDMGEVDFQGGVQYTYTVTLKQPTSENPDPVTVKLESTIIGWEKESQEIELDEAKDEAENPDESETPDINTNLDLKAFTLQSSAYLYTVTIDGNVSDALKLGSSSNIGKCESAPIKADCAELSFYAVCWASKKGSLKITVNNGGKINGKSSVTIEPRANNGASGGGTNYTMTITDDDRYTFTLSEITAATTLVFETLESADDKRAVFFGVNVR